MKACFHYCSIIWDGISDNLGDELQLEKDALKMCRSWYGINKGNIQWARRSSLKERSNIQKGFFMEYRNLCLYITSERHVKSRYCDTASHNGLLQKLWRTKIAHFWANVQWYRLNKPFYLSSIFPRNLSIHLSVGLNERTDGRSDGPSVRLFAVRPLRKKRKVLNTRSSP